MAEIQLMIPSPALSPNTTPYTTAPSSPHRFPTFFYSAPTSPIHSLAFPNNDVDNDFAFDFNGPLEPPSISAADELFHCGQIKPLKPVSPQTISNQKSLVPTSRSSSPINHQTPNNTQNRGREKYTNNTRNIHKSSRSSSPFRISDILSDDEEENIINQKTWYNKWNLKNLLLFRSASEGSARRSSNNIKEQVIINKYSRIIRKCDHINNDVKNSSFRSTDSSSCGSVTTHDAGSNRSSRVMMRKVSAHEIHYTANRAISEEMRKKTYLPYKSGLFGCLGFHHNNNGAGGGSVHHEISRGIHSVMKQR
uniref:uncharacterized protein LOC122591865 n=1 Tax=Erigeron canadensis TaxID=72917 RepID=UPI001CB98B7E|nr:uncharacterized protein LOC122591865 [Erigeron canadensis]